MGEQCLEDYRKNQKDPSWLKITLAIIALAMSMAGIAAWCGVCYRIFKMIAGL